jgi:hypothetical protein
MGVEHNSYTSIGYEFDAEGLSKFFLIKVPEVSHMEERFDPKTGKPVAPVKVVDRAAGEAFQIPGTTEIYDDTCLQSFIEEELAAYLGCSVDVSFNAWDGTIGNVVFCPDLEFRGSSIPLGYVMELMPKFDQIKLKLEKLGIEVGPVVITTIDQVF